MKQENKNRLRMKDLTEATGLPKSTILHYVAQGLLPEPTRTSRNMAYYDPACVERAQFVRVMQEKYSFPLERIKKLLSSRDEGSDINHLAELDTVIFGATTGQELGHEDFLHATGLSADQASDLMVEGLLMPLAEGVYRQDDVEAGRTLAAGYVLGIKPSDLAFYVKAAKEVVDHEMRLRQRLTGDLPEGEDAQLTARLTKNARLLRNYVMDRVFQRRVAAANNLKDEALLS
jgi:DNA-binding transcriptional MerR regulator